MSLKIRAEAHARKMKVISAGISFMGNYSMALDKLNESKKREKILQVMRTTLS